MKTMTKNRKLNYRFFKVSFFNGRFKNDRLCKTRSFFNDR